ncbi:snare associated Golgi protein-domain-containing protein [Flammula alnicola]|nr:snare associated Golgi protein-domain-containing protein [Flammula alnicola]
MAVTLQLPPKSRSRASSTNLRPAATCQSLGRRRSTSFLQVREEPHPTPPPIDTDIPPDPSPPPTMLAWFLSRFIQWLHLPQKHTLSWSTPSSPRSSTDDFLLPLSASAHSVSFTVVEPDKLSSHLFRWRFPVHAPIIIVILLFPISTCLVLWCLSTLPISLAWPHDIADLAQLGRELHGYSQSGPGPLSHVIGVMAISAVWKHAWSIPGSVLWNVLGGALFSPFYATILLTTLTTVGSICATLLSTPLGPFLSKIFPRALDMTRSALGGDSDADADNSGNQLTPKSSPWVRLSVLRLIGVVPWSGINIACGVCGVSLVDCMLGTFIGCLPWTAVTCQIGDILQTVASTPTSTSQTVSSLLTTPEIILKLVFLSVLSLAPILGRRQLRSIISNKPSSSGDVGRESRWTWIQEWRTKIRLASRSQARGREQDQLTLNALVDEKRRLEDDPSYS